MPTVCQIFLFLPIQPLNDNMQRQRVSRFNTLFLGQPTSDRGLQNKSVRDRTARAYNLAPPRIYAPGNARVTAPRHFHVPVPRHANPLEMPDVRRHSRYAQGSSLYRQAIQAQIGHLSRLV
jgi:hypothetical protein